MTSFGAGQHRVVRAEPDEVLDLFDRSFRLGARQIDFVDDGDQLQIVFNCQISIRERLRLDTLRRIDN